MIFSGLIGALFGSMWGRTLPAVVDGVQSSLERTGGRAYHPAMGQESRSRRRRAQGRETPKVIATNASAEMSTREVGPEQSLISKYGARPIPELSGAVQKFHLKVVTDVLAGHDRGAGPVGATRVWHAHHDGLAASRPGDLNFGGTVKRLACAPGCHHCCRSPVGVVAAEAVLVAEVVDRTFSGQERVELARRMEERRAALRGDALGTYLCPLNVNGRCLVYEVRPYNCRAFHSFDVGACERVFLAGEPQGGLPIDPVRRKYDRLIAASATVAFTALRIDMRMIEFMAALELALAAGERRCERLVGGEDLFAGLPTIVPPSSAVTPA